MPRDYAHLPRPKKKKTLTFIRWLIIIVLLIAISLIVAGIIYHKQQQPASSQEVTKPLAVVSEATPQLPDTQEATKKKPDPKVSFDFYTMLPRMSVKTFNNNSLATKASTTQDQYILQIISLANLDDANAFIDKLKKAGFTANLIPVYQNHTKWYRIQMGPYKDLEKAQKIRDALQTKDFSCILITRHP